MAKCMEKVNKSLHFLPLKARTPMTVENMENFWRKISNTRDHFKVKETYLAVMDSLASKMEKSTWETSSKESSAERAFTLIRKTD